MSPSAATHAFGDSFPFSADYDDGDGEESSSTSDEEKDEDLSKKYLEKLISTIIRQLFNINNHVAGSDVS